MKLANREIRTSADLVAYTQQKLKAGYLVASRRDPEDPVIGFLDELAVQRSDWHPAIAVTLHELAQSGGKNHHAALLQMLSTGMSGPAFVDTATAILDSHGDLRSKTTVGLQGISSKKRLSETVETLQNAADYYRCGNLQVLFFGPEMGAFPIDTGAELLTAAVASLTRTPSCFPLPMPLAWLRKFAFFTPSIATQVPDLLGALAELGQPEAAAAIGEYVLLGGDQALLIDCFTDWLDRAPAWLDVEGPSAYEVANQRALADMVQDALALALYQRNTAPTDITLH